ncbi:MAG: secondary thiamine-phosphate synthase enzyme YjbQ [Thermoprotei archaeon]
MKVYVREITVSTQKRFQLIDLTSKVEEIVESSGVKSGIALVFAPHATAAIIANEHESGLMEDIIEKVKEFTEPGSSKWRHNIIDDNAHAHIGSALFGAERVFPVVNGRLVRGVWQNIFLLEMDGPRSKRSIYVVVIGEG